MTESFKPGNRDRNLTAGTRLRGYHDQNSRKVGKGKFHHNFFLQTVHNRRRRAKSTRWMFLVEHCCHPKLA